MFVFRVFCIIEAPLVTSGAAKLSQNQDRFLPIYCHTKYTDWCSLNLFSKFGENKEITIP